MTCDWPECFEPVAAFMVDGESGYERLCSTHVKARAQEWKRR